MTYRSPRGTLDFVGQSAAPSTREGAAESVWDRTVVGWHAAFWVVLAIALVGTVSGLGSEGTNGGRLAVAAVALVVLGIAYAFLAIPAAGDRSPPRARAYLAVLCAVVGLALAASGQAGFLLFIAYPQVWFFSAREREGAAWTVILTAVAAWATLLRVGASPAALREVGVTFGVSLALSLLLGLWISSVIAQSQRRAELIEELRRTQGELAEAEHAAGVLAERARVAQEVHDTLTQGFASIAMVSQSALARLRDQDERVAAALRTIEQTARENVQEARALVAAFTPAPLQGSTLGEALERLGERFGAETGTEVEVHVDADAAAGLTRDREVVLLRAAQEALSNVRRHAAASRVVLRLSRGTGWAAIDVEDDGVGFDQGRPPGYGLAGMRRRVEDVGGTLGVESAPDRGTSVRIHVPSLTSDGGG